MRKFWRRNETSAERFERVREAHRERRPGTEAALDELLGERAFVRAATGGARWELEFGRHQLRLGWDEEAGELAGVVSLGRDLDRPGEALDLLVRNADPRVRLPWFALGPDDAESPLRVVVRVPFDSFERATVLLVLEQLAAVVEMAGPAETHVREGTCIWLPGGERAEGPPDASAREAVRSALEVLELPATEEADRPGVWRAELERDSLSIVLADRGESLLIARLLYPLDWNPADPEVARYLLKLSELAGARIAYHEGVDIQHATAVVPAAALKVADLAYGLREAVTLGAHYDEDSGFYD